MKALVTVPAAFVVLAAVFSSGSAKGWLDEVHWIIAPAEREEFQSLDGEEAREAFRQRFWARRDPTPATPRNEYKDEYYRRLDFARRQFREGMPGWRSDRGRVYLLHGPPDAEEQLGEASGNAYGIGRRSPLLAWKYNRLEAAGPIVFLFQADAGGPVAGSAPAGQSAPGRGPRPIFSRSGTKYDSAAAAAVRYRLVAAGPPAILSGASLRVTPELERDSARLLADLLRPPGELLLQREAEEARRAASREQLAEQIETRVHFADLAVRMAPYTFYEAGEGKVVIAWEWAGSGKPADLLAQVREEGRLVDEFFRVLDAPPAVGETGAAAVHDVNEFRLPAGEYLLSSLVREIDSDRLGAAAAELQVDPPAPGQLRLSSLVLAANLLPRDDRAPLGRELNVGEWRLQPRPDASFSAGEKLILLARVYPSAPASKVAASFKVLRENGVFRESPARLLEPDGEGALVYTSVLELEDFPPGSYVLQLTAVELEQRKFSIARSRFEVR